MGAHLIDRLLATLGTSPAHGPATYRVAYPPHSLKHDTMNTRILSCFLIAFTCVPALLCAQQQEDQLFALTRMEPAEGRADAAQEQLKKMSLAYYANGPDLPTYWNKYDDGALEVVHPIRDYAELDRVDALFDFAYVSRDSTERKVNFDRQLFSKNVPVQEAKLLRLHYDKTYLPEQEEGAETDHPRLLLYDIRPGIARSEVYAHARKLVAMLEEVKSPVRVSFYTYDMGENNRRIEIELDAPDAAALRKQQQQESERLLGDRLTEWRKERDRLAEQVGSHELTYLRDMSQKA